MLSVKSHFLHLSNADLDDSCDDFIWIISFEFQCDCLLESVVEEERHIESQRREKLQHTNWKKPIQKIEMS